MAPAQSPHTHRERPAPSIATRRLYYTAVEVARDFLGMSPSQFYRSDTRRRLHHGPDYLPFPYCTRPLRWDRTTMDQWKKRQEAARIPAAANDDAPLSIEQRRERLAELYQQRGAT